MQPGTTQKGALVSSLRSSGSLALLGTNLLMRLVQSLTAHGFIIMPAPQRRNGRRPTLPACIGLYLSRRGTSEGSLSATRASGRYSL